jgi:hypothetical protein
MTRAWTASAETLSQGLGNGDESCSRFIRKLTSYIQADKKEQSLYFYSSLTNYLFYALTGLAFNGSSNLEAGHG